MGRQRSDKELGSQENISGAQKAIHFRWLPILTNKPQIFADQCVAHFLARWPWRVVQGQVEGLAVKPSTDVSNLVTSALGLAPEEVLYFGDSDVDMYTAGYRAVGVTWGFRSEAELRATRAQDIVHSPGQIVALLV
jgi:phosphoglycolate phosphatase